jgi:peptide/nickel transport system substrate-binding protein
VPNPVLVNQLTELRIMSKAWAEKNKSVEPKDIKTKDETFAHRNALGTGPYVLKSGRPTSAWCWSPTRTGGARASSPPT